MKRPEDVTLSREEGEALLARLEANTLSAEDRQVLRKVLTFYFWLLFALREAKLSLKRLKALVFGEKPKKREPPTSDGRPGGSGAGGSSAKTGAPPGEPEATASELPEGKPHPAGHGRQGAEVYRAAQTVECRHEELAVGERCPACGGKPNKFATKGNKERKPEYSQAYSETLRLRSAASLTQNFIVLTV